MLFLDFLKSRLLVIQGSVTTKPFPATKAKVTLSYILLDFTPLLSISTGTWLFFLLFHYCLVVQSLSYVQLFVAPWTAARQTSLSFTISWNLLKLMTTESVMPSNHHILCCPLRLLPSVLPSIITIYLPLIRMHIPQDLTCFLHGCRGRKMSWWGAQNSRPGPVTFRMCPSGQLCKPSRLQFPYPKNYDNKSVYLQNAARIFKIVMCLEQCWHMLC